MQTILPPLFFNSLIRMSVKPSSLTPCSCRISSHFLINCFGYSFNFTVTLSSSLYGLVGRGKYICWVFRVFRNRRYKSSYNGIASAMIGEARVEVNWLNTVDGVHVVCSLLRQQASQGGLIGSGIVEIVTDAILIKKRN